ncbi:histidine phosphatase family protein [Rugosimonospora acidiphila]|uniref:phosphoglycerate mutase (2,3-diphosphoglycerate-dependent) n=1 Tax=Rugosimonospora acidiphila TaxID=556531 RepID=A0ABP9SBU6_9ACTN
MTEFAELIAVRHGESTSNAEFAAAEEAARLPVGIRGPDADIPLSELGHRQAAALGRRLAALPPERVPELVLCSPYLRARQTYEVAAAAAGPNAQAWTLRLDRRLGDRVMGELQLMTKQQIAERYPEEAARRSADGEFVYRPPGGESFGDIADRLADLLDEVRGAHGGRRAMVVAHDAVVLMLRRIVEGLSWNEIEDIARDGLAANASVTRWVNVDGRLVLAEYNSTAHLRDLPPVAPSADPWVTPREPRSPQPPR